MEGAGIEGRIFVVGAPRSGTTLVQSLLAAHPRVTSFTESHFFDRHFHALLGRGPTLLTRDPLPRMREFLRENDEEPTAAAGELEARRGRLAGPRLRLPGQTRWVGRRLLRIFDELARRRRRGVWVEKTPRHLHHLRFLDRLSEEAPKPRFVHVIRDGLRVALSLHRASRHWVRAYDLETCARRWNEDLGRSLRRLGSSRDHFVFYEELVADPEPVLERLIGELDLNWRPEIVAGYSRQAETLITPEEASWKDRVAGGIRPQGTTDGASEEERRRLERLLRPDLYERLREAVKVDA